MLVGDEAYYSRVGFKVVPKGRVDMPGPVDYGRLLVAELVDGAFDGVSGAIRPDWSHARAIGAVVSLARMHGTFEKGIDNILELQIRKRAHADARQQDLVLGVGDRIADVFVQQVVADETDRHFARAEPGRIELGLVADFRL